MLAGSATAADWLGVSREPPLSDGDGIFDSPPISLQTKDDLAPSGLPISLQANVDGVTGRMPVSLQSYENGVSGELLFSLGTEEIRDVNRLSTPLAPNESGVLVVLPISLGAGDRDSLPPATNPPTPAAASPVATHTTAGSFVACSEATPCIRAWCA
jgi:hypothetical protein